LFERRLRYLLSGIIAHSKMTGVRVVWRGSVLVHFRFEPFVVAAQAARGSARIREDCGMALSAARLNIEFLSCGSEGRNRRAPQWRRSGRLRQAGQVGCNLGNLLIRQILVRHECRHGFSRPLANGAQELLVGQSMARESLGKSTFSVLTVTKFAIVLKSEITLPYPCSFLNIRDGRSLGLSLDLSQDKQKQCGKDTIHGFSLVLKNSGSSIAKNVYSPFRRQAETGCLHI